jgi:glycosyltransferase involved in cell wall biosynthesis
MGHALPIVSTRAGAVPDTVPSDVGLLVPPEDADAFAGALRCLLGDAGLRAHCAASALRHAKTLPDWADAAKVVAEALFGHNDRRTGYRTDSDPSRVR